MKENGILRPCGGLTMKKNKVGLKQIALCVPYSSQALGIFALQFHLWDMVLISDRGLFSVHENHEGRKKEGKESERKGVGEIPSLQKNLIADRIR